MSEPWQIYFDEFLTRARPILGQRFERDQDLAEAAHEAYQRTADRLTGSDGWGDDEALGLTRGFNEAVRQWLRSPSRDTEALRERLRERWSQWGEASG